MAQRSYSDFEIGERLGTGTVGTVFAAKCDNKPVAVKILQPNVSADPIVRQRFQREVVVLEKLNHPNIIAYYDTGEHDGRLFYSMEYVEGATLKEILQKRGKLTWEEATECGWQICSALQHAHNNGVVHRDLKPSNVFVTHDGDIKLFDFGIALDLGATEITDHGMTVGSYLYMAPEQIRGEKTISQQTDLYALGCLMFELLTGGPPYKGTNFAEIFEQHLRTEPPLVSRFVGKCPQDLVEVVTQMLAKSPHDRPLNAREVQGILAEVMLEAGDRVTFENGERQTQKRFGPEFLKRVFDEQTLDVEQPSLQRMLIVGAIIVAITIFAFIANSW